MSKLLFKLRNVPNDEADDVRKLLADHQIDYYETTAGNWGISMPAIWITHDEQLDEAKRLFDAYQAQRTLTIRTEYARLKKEGKYETLLGRITENPLLYLIYTLAVILLLYLPYKLVLEIVEKLQN
ncbi:MAG: hypothetical protein IPI97_02985 [Nitrosomonas sp.]|nr:hypothetical protein [Nitrosomonas sp.]